MNTSYALLLTHALYLVVAIIILFNWYKLNNKLREIEKSI